MFLLKVPEPWRTRVVKFGRGVEDLWLEISSGGIMDYSHHAKTLKSLVITFLRDVPLGEYRDWHGSTRDWW